MGKYTQVKYGLLNCCHPIFEILSSNDAPIWWENVKKDKSLYIEIRKENYLNVYYKGGCIAKISYNQRKKHFEIVTHPKYLERSVEFNPECYKRRKKDGETVYEAIYQDCTEWLESPNKLEHLKNNVERIYSRIDEGENASEKSIQGKLITQNREKYLDSEFAYQFYDGKRNTIRIDLIKIENDKFIFEELKRIKDTRLRTTKGEPEILTQMKKYEGFLRQNKDALTTYYRILYKIKKQLKLPLPKVRDIDSIVVDPKPTLLIFNNYEKMGPDRADRINDIDRILKEKDIRFTITSES